MGGYNHCLSRIRNHCLIIEYKVSTNNPMVIVNLCKRESYNTVVMRQWAGNVWQVVKTVMYSALHQGPFSFKWEHNGHIKGLWKQNTSAGFPYWLCDTTRACCETPAVHYPLWGWFEKYSQRHNFCGESHRASPSPIQLRHVFIITM